MIKTSTVFVLGAGASYPYRFPLGNQLIDFIAEQSTVRNLLVKCGFTTQEITDFITALLESRALSVDAWLQINQEYLKIGRHAVAASILVHEIGANLRPVDDNWFRYLWHRMTEGASDLMEFDQNNVRFISYNYDRSFQTMLRQAIDHTFPKASAQARGNTLGRLSPVHLHGVLAGPARFGSLEALTAQEVVSGAEDLLIPCQIQGECRRHDNARFRLREADRVVFIGCGYHTQAIDRLWLNDRWTHRQARPPVWGTGYGLNGTERARVQSLGIALGEAEMKTTEFLRQIDLM